MPRPCDWKRFWIPRGERYTLDDHGYLADPDAGGYAKVIQPLAVATDHIWNSQCVALLGEPGIGKSTTIIAAVEAARKVHEINGDFVTFMDLRSYGSEDRLLRNIEGSEAWKIWAAGSNTLHLFFDSLDECGQSIPTVAAILVDVLKKHRDLLPRMRLRLACRTAEWPELLDNELPPLFPKGDYRAYELLPLRRCDIEELARVEGLDTAAFMRAVSNADAHPLAARPVTSMLLTDIFKFTGSLPKSKAALYEQGCRGLCEETNRSRTAAGKRGDLDPDQRLAIARRIAAVAMLCNKAEILVGEGGVAGHDGQLTVAELNGGNEPIAGGSADVTENALREVLGTALFSGRSAGSLGFAHQTYMEFLAADYLRLHRLDRSQLRSLLYHPDGSDRHIVPQLSETVAWLATRDSAFFGEVVETDPLLLLRTDVAVLSERDREAVVGSILCQMEQGKANDFEWSLRRYYARFNHPNLATQMEQLIRDKSKNIIVRRTAIGFAEATNASALQDALVEVALDPTDDYQIRDRASSALTKIGDEAHREGLLPLLAAPPSEDPNDQLRANALESLWPERLILLPELLDAMSPPRRTDFWGSYRIFLDSVLLKHLKIPEELPPLLRWLCTHNVLAAGWSEPPFARLSDRAVLAAWKHTANPEVCSALSAYVLSSAAAFRPVLSHYATKDDQFILDEDVEGRTRVITGIVVSNASDGTFAACASGLQTIGIVGGDDFAWLMCKAELAAAEDTSRKYATLALYTFYASRDPAKLERLLESPRTKPAVRAVFREVLEPVILDSDTAKHARELLREMKKLDLQANMTPTQQVPPVEDRIKSCLNRFDAGNTDAWEQLSRTLMFNESGQPTAGDFELELHTPPEWQPLDVATRGRILVSSREYLLRVDPKSESWIGTLRIPHPAFAGFRALCLLYHEDRYALLSLPAEVWGKWAAIILGFPVAPGISGETPIVYEIAAMAYRNVPEEFIRTLLRLVECENSRTGLGNIFILQRLRNCWDDRLYSAMLEKANDPALKPAAVGDILEELMVRCPERATALAASLISIPVPASGRGRDIAVQAAVKLLLLARDGGWTKVWPAICHDLPFGRAVLETVAHDYRQDHPGELARRLTEEQAADLFIWLEQQYPQATDPQHEGSYWSSARDAVGELRNWTLIELQNRGTREAVAAIRRITLTFPKQPWLKHSLLSAENQMRRLTWSPPSPAEVIELCASGSSRLVRSESDLQALLVETLNEIGADLQGETPSAPDLWNTIDGRQGQARPKDENHFSDWIKRQLELRLKARNIVAMREVQIRRGEGGGPMRGKGENTDIYVTASLQGPPADRPSTARVIIETKGCWHPELETAMQSQLVDRYLRDNPCRHGIYLVGWFQYSQWDEMDNRRSKTPKKTIDEARLLFENQARGCSTGNLVIRAVVLNAALR